MRQARSARRSQTVSYTHLDVYKRQMDGVSEVKDIIKRAKQWGMDAIAVTDHGCVQAFPDANHAVDKGENFKILYGVEGYLVDDMKELAEDEKGQTLDHTCVVFDIETTGFSPIKNHIIEKMCIRDRLPSCVWKITIRWQYSA